MRNLASIWMRLCLPPVLTLGVLALAALQPVLADPAPVESFAQQSIDHGIAILNDKSLTADARRAAVESFLLSMLDMRRIALYVLGPAARTASPADVAAFEDAFQKFTLSNYESELGAYSGQTLKITSSIEHAPGDFVVKAEVLDPTASAGDAPVEVSFRIFDEGGKFAILDANIEGVWFEVAQHDDIQGFLAQNGGSVPKLVDHLNQMTAGLAARQQ